MNTTFEVEPSTTEDSSSGTENKPKSQVSTKPPKIPRQTSYSGRSALKAVQIESDVRSSDEFEKPKLLRKSVSAGMLKKKRSSAEIKETSDGDSDVSELLDSFGKKKRKLNNPKQNYFGMANPE